MVKVSEKVVIDLTKALANVGTPQQFCGEVAPSDGLLPYPDAHFEKVSMQFDVTFVNSDVEIQGNILCDVAGRCDKCLTEVHKQFVLPFQQVFFKGSGADGEYCYDGSKLDATKAVQDEIVLSLPTLLLCDENCKGLCPKCGVNRNTTQCNCDTHKQNPFSQLLNLKF